MSLILPVPILTFRSFRETGSEPSAERTTRDAGLGEPGERTGNYAPACIHTELALCRSHSARTDHTTDDGSHKVGWQSEEREEGIAAEVGNRGGVQQSMTRRPSDNEPQRRADGSYRQGSAMGTNEDAFEDPQGSPGCWSGEVARVQLNDLARPKRRTTAAAFEVVDPDVKAFELPLRYIQDTKTRRVGETLRNLQVFRAEEPKASTMAALLEDEIDVRVTPRVGISTVAEADNLVLPGAFYDGMVRISVIGHQERPPAALSGLACAAWL
jgi:hypothetical protein